MGCKIYENNYVKMVDTYRKSKINLVILQEANGIYGLTSILNSFSVGRPPIVIKTSKMSMNIEKEGFRLEVSVSSESKLGKATNELLTTQSFYNTCISNMEKWSEVHNSKFFA